MIPKVKGGRAVAREIMINNNAIANLIRRNQLGQIYTVIQTSSQDGMVTMNKSIDELLRKGEISVDVARNRKRDLETKASYF